MSEPINPSGAPQPQPWERPTEEGTRPLPQTPAPESGASQPAAPQQPAQSPYGPVGAPPTTWAHGDHAPYGPARPPEGEAPVYGPVLTSQKRRHPARRLLLVLLTALLVAALAVAGTWLALRPRSAQPEVGGSGTRTVEQADPVNPNWATTAKVVAPSVVSIRVTAGRAEGEGSGVVLDNAGHIVTNHHVVALGGKPEIVVSLDDRRAYAADVVGTDAATDLAVLKLRNAPSDLQPIALGDDTKLRVGDPVMAVGNPLGLSGTVTTGIVSALNRPSRTQQEDGSGTVTVTNAIQTSAAINPGNSGGALVNASGQLVGINSAIASLGSNGQGGNIGIGFAIPVNEVKNVARQLMEHGSAKHALLGVTGENAVLPDGGDQRSAARITSVSAGSAADRAGLRQGDGIVAVDGETVDSFLSLRAQIAERTVGDQVTLTVLRDGARQDLHVVLDERR